MTITKTFASQSVTRQVKSEKLPSSGNENDQLRVDDIFSLKSHGRISDTQVIRLKPRDIMPLKRLSPSCRREGGSWEIDDGEQKRIE